MSLTFIFSKRKASRGNSGVDLSLAFFVSYHPHLLVPRLPAFLVVPSCHVRDSEGEDDNEDDRNGEENYPAVTMAGVGPPPTGPESMVQAVLMEASAADMEDSRKNILEFFREFKWGAARVE